MGHLLVYFMQTILIHGATEAELKYEKYLTLGKAKKVVEYKDIKNQLKASWSPPNVKTHLRGTCYQNS